MATAMPSAKITVFSTAAAAPPAAACGTSSTESSTPASPYAAVSQPTAAARREAGTGTGTGASSGASLLSGRPSSAQPQAGHWAAYTGVSQMVARRTGSACPQAGQAQCRRTHRAFTPHKRHSSAPSQPRQARASKRRFSTRPSKSSGTAGIAATHSSKADSTVRRHARWARPQAGLCFSCRGCPGGRRGGVSFMAMPPFCAGLHAAARSARFLLPRPGCTPARRRGKISAGHAVFCSCSPLYHNMPGKRLFFAGARPAHARPCRAAPLGVRNAERGLPFRGPCPASAAAAVTAARIAWQCAGGTRCRVL